MTPFDETRLGRSGQVYAAAAAEGRPALVGYLPVGFPSVPGSLAAFQALVRGRDGVGVDLVEIGMPYSDPVMDGIAIQHATARALERGVRTRDIFEAVQTVSEVGGVAVVMIYWNLVERYGANAFARDLASVGGCGLITPDLTPDEADDWMIASDEHGLDRIFLVSPSSTPERIESTLAACRGWVYATSVMGVTGARSETSTAAPQLVSTLKSSDSGLPVGVGLGISNGDQAAELGAFADGVIVGSALVKKLIEADRDSNEAAGLVALRDVVSDLADGVRRAR